MATAPVTYPLDLTGNNPANLVKNELQVLSLPNDTPYRFFAPTFAPFYLTDNMSITGLDQTGVRIELKQGIDYYPSLIFQAATWSTGRLVYAGITIMNTKINGPFYMTYQCLGGKYSANRNFVMEQIAEYNYNPRTHSWDQITNIQEQFPPTDHPQDIDTFTGFRDLLDGVYSIRDVLGLRPGPNNIIWKHVLDLQDPHETLRLIPAIGDFATKKDVADAIINHVAQPDPHSQYLLKDDYVPGGGGGEVDCDKCIKKHTDEPDPHPQYLTKAEAAATYLTPAQAEATFLTEDQVKDLIGNGGKPATDSTPGIIKIATPEEMKDKNNNSVAVTPKGVNDLIDEKLTGQDPLPQYLTEQKGNALYYPRSEADATFMKKGEIDAKFLTKTDADAKFLSKTEADQKYLTPQTADQRYMNQEKGDARYALKGDLGNFLTKEQAESLYGPNGTNKPVIPDASMTVKGITRYATELETRNGTISTAAVTPNNLKVAAQEIVDTAVANIGIADTTFGSPALRLFYAIY